MVFFCNKNIKMYYVYILKWDKYYVGYTWNLKHRMFQHSHWLCKTIKKLNITKLVWYFQKDTKQEALILEKMIKRDWHIEHRINHETFIQLNKNLLEI